MILRSSPPSPFGRKCKLAIAILGLTNRIEVVKADTMDPKDSLRQQNPLGKIPILITDDGLELYDSPVICEYLDDIAGGGKIFPKGAERWGALRLQALGDGMMDAGLLQVYEARYRPAEVHHQPWLDMQAGKVERGLTWLEANTPKIGDTPTIGDITLACALGYLDFRFDGAWRKGHPKLVAWLDAFADKVPAFAETTPVG